MAANGEAVAQGWPMPGDPEWANADEQTRKWLESTQPEALERCLTETIADAFHALSYLAMFADSFPQAALDNAMGQLPPERAEVFREQLEFTRAYSTARHERRGTEGSMEDSLFSLTMKAARPYRHQSLFLAS